MLLRASSVLLALGASLANALPNPTTPENLIGARAEAKVAKLTE
jgi:hypothetical protein